MAATDTGAIKFERFEARADRAPAGRIEFEDKKRKPADDDEAILRGPVRLGLPPSERQAPAAYAAENDNAPEFDHRPPSDDEDEAVSETLTVAEIKRRMQRPSLRGPHPCDGRVPLRATPADDEGEEDEVTAALAVLGADPGSYRLEKKQAVRLLFSGIYSPPRLTAMLKRMTDHGLAPSLAMDLRTNDPDDGTPCDFDPRRRARRHCGCRWSISLCSPSARLCARGGVHGSISTMFAVTLTS